MLIWEHNFASECVIFHEHSQINIMHILPLLESANCMIIYFHQHTFLSLSFARFSRIINALEILLLIDLNRWSTKFMFSFCWQKWVITRRKTKTHARYPFFTWPSVVPLLKVVVVGNTRQEFRRKIITNN